MKRGAWREGTGRSSQRNVPAAGKDLQATETMEEAFA